MAEAIIMGFMIMYILWYLYMIFKTALFKRHVDRRLKIRGVIQIENNGDNNE